MEVLILEVPAMYGDHHVVEVRRILLAIPGVEEVFASSSFHTVEVSFDPEKTNDLEIAIRLDEAGYLGEWSVIAERGRASDEGGGPVYFRHTTVFEQTKHVVGFAQDVQITGRPLWPCPGMGPIMAMDEEN